LAATFEWDEDNGAGQTRTHGLSNCNWGNVDQANLDPTVEANKITIGENSYSKYIFGHFSGTYGQIGPNGKLWKSGGSLPGNVYLKAGMLNTYATPSKTATGDSDIPTSEGAALAVNFGSSPENATNPSTTSNPAYSAFWRSQIQTQSGAAPGSIGSQTITLKYDES